MTKSVLILGASGRFGRHAAEAFWNRGWRVRIFDRTRDDLMTAAAGQDVIVNGWNPPYDKWAEVVPGLTERVIEAARASGATVLVPGNVYVYGKGSPEVLSADVAHRAENTLGRVRREMEDAYRASGVQVILLRAGDFLDTEPSGNWFDKVMVTGIGKGRFSYPGTPDIPHAWAWLPDLARVAEALADRRKTLGTFTDVPFEGYTLSGTELAAACGEALGRDVRLSRMVWLPLWLMQPVWPMARHLLEMRYLWDMPHRLDGTRLAELVPEFRATPVVDALRQALAHERPTGHADAPVVSGEAMA